MKEKRLLLLLLLIFSSCLKENRTIPIDNWNNLIISKLNKTDSLIYKQEDLKKNIDFILEFRKDIAEEINKLKSKEGFLNFVVYENFNCEFNPKDTVQIDIPFTKNKFYYNILILSDKKNYSYELRGFSENKNQKFTKLRIENKEEYLEHLNLENIGIKKTKYLLNDFSVISKITCNGNDLNIEVISTRLN
ncbi:MAG: hypothetical protein LDL23_00015 [Flavobacterium sp.]|uniref:hypothetical protein n=1 Tax=Flavobacterium sp. TaxID=239 RepID=UPI0025B8BB17|nr:hypothetical protein [Flavobacterium sp.]MCA1965010.1 hypothetical protein [Flavobacterium sp.]